MKEEDEEKKYTLTNIITSAAAAIITRISHVFFVYLQTVISLFQKLFSIFIGLYVQY